jgi:hypothetical protein
MGRGKGEGGGEKGNGQGVDYRVSLVLGLFLLGFIVWLGSGSFGLSGFAPHCCVVLSLPHCYLISDFL